MAEPRARVSRHKGQLNFGPELKTLLYAFGAPTNPSEPSTQPSDPYPETLRLLDEIVTDFIIETCHSAVSVASYSGRQKLKMDDFLWVLRKDTAKLGRVKRALWKEKQMKQSRRIFDASAMGGPGQGGGRGADGLGVGELSTLAEEGGEVGTRKGVGRGRGRKRKSEQVAEDAGEDGQQQVDGEKPKAKKLKKKLKEEAVD